MEPLLRTLDGPAGAALLAGYLVSLCLLSLLGLHRFALALLYLRHRRAPPVPAAARLPTILVQLPVFNERNVVERLIDAACGLEWPRDRLAVQVLDDSTDDTTAAARASVAQWRARGVDVALVRREERTGFKAGALAHGLDAGRGELVAVFDADFVPSGDFLERVVPWFADPTVGMVQARWGHMNERASALTRAEAMLLDGHFVVEHTARNRSGRFFNFNGTCGVWRRETIDDSGGWEHDTTTEDLDLSYRAQLRGWRFVYLPDVVVPGELPASMRAFKSQQHRWAKGSIQTARKLLPRILASDQSIYVKAEAAFHLLGNFAYPLVLLVALLLPPAVAVRGRGDLSELLLLDLPAFATATGSVAFFYAVASMAASGSTRLVRLPLLMAMGIGMAVSQTRAVMDGLFGSDVTFVRTPKDGVRRLRAYAAARDWTTWVELGLFAWLFAGCVVAAGAGYWASLPFLGLFAGGFGWVGVASFVEGSSAIAAESALPETPVTESAAAAG